jgi:hypothetical protein
MKYFFILFLFFPSVLYSQYFYELGYVVKIVMPYDTIFGQDISIPDPTYANTKTIKMDINKKTIKFQKDELLDFGSISQNSKKRISKHTERGLKGLYLYGVDMDTFPCYVKYKPSYLENSIKAYALNATPLNLEVENIEAFMIEEGNEKFWYDAIRTRLPSYNATDYEGFPITVNPVINSYGIRLADGFIRLNGAIASNGDYILILRKQYEFTLILTEKGLLTLQAKHQLKQLMQDEPTIMEKLFSKGYTYDHIKDIVKEYNALKLKQ